MMATQLTQIDDKPRVLTRTIPSTDKKQDKLIQRALLCLESRIKQTPYSVNNPAQVRDYLRLQLAQEVNEVFAVVFLNIRLEVLAFERLFVGTVHSAQVYPRVVLQRVLLHNAVAVILAHNHPSGSLKPSHADRSLTETLSTVLGHVDAQVLDHVIVSATGTTSFKELGLLH